MQYDVVIVGAGPTGLALGAELYRLGATPLILDRQAEGQNTSRACVIHARTLEVLEAIGATPDLLQQGLIVSTFRIREGDRVLSTISFADLKTAYPYTLMCPQNRVEAILLERLQSLGGSVQRPTEVVDVRPSINEVDLQIKNAEGAETIQAKWVIGCDGAHSVVREQSAIPFEGGAYEESFLLADLEMDWPLDRDEVTLFYADDGLMVVAPLPGNHYRVVATVQHALAEPTVSDFESILKQRGPQNGLVSIRRMDWASRFHIQHKVAQEMRKGRIILAGDAAHVHSPAGGQGMNTGIQDAISLAGALNRTLRDGDDAILDKWQKERLKIVHSVVDMTDRLTRIATISSPIFKRFRNTAIELIGNIPFAQHAMAEKLSELRHQ
jgi:2-polyprenyl-6-methoxyphenol hydroxylase-like FAD-dependent oxidoreductase